MPTDQIKKAIQSGWDRMSATYQSETRISLDDIHYGPLCPGERELRLLGDVRGKRVLELACGAAQNSIALAKWNAHVVAMDISPEQLAAARALVARESVAVHLARGDMEQLGMFADGRFDIVISSFGWEFVPDLAACFAERNRVLKKGGLLVVCTVHPLAAFEWDQAEEALLVTDYFNPPVELWGDLQGAGRGHAMTFYHTVQELFGLLTSCGFRVERVLEPFPYALETMTDSERLEIPYGGQFWESQYERLCRVPFSIVLTGRKS